MTICATVWIRRTCADGLQALVGDRQRDLLEANGKPEYRLVKSLAAGGLWFHDDGGTHHGQARRQGRLCGGAVINTTSYVAIAGIKGRDAYTAAKSGVLALTGSLAANYAKYNIRVNAIAPGAIQTERMKKFLAADPRLGENG